jgi:hypothetical protein
VTSLPHVPISWGELLDKISILEIKAARLSEEAARANVEKELAMLRQIAEPVRAHPHTGPLIARLKAINETLWEVEDQIREHEARGDFGEGFIALARAVYRRNDERGAVKRELNLMLGSALIEEKSYKPY